MIKVIVISDIKIYCEGLSQIISNTKSIQVVGAENNVEDAIAKIEHDLPDVILLDMTMVDSCGVAQKVMQTCPNAKIVALAVPENENNILECAEAGITGYVSRESSLDELIIAVIGAKKGEFYCPPKIAAYIFNKVNNIAVNAKRKYLLNAIDDEHIHQSLTQRERQIASLLKDGLSNKQIARSLSIEVSTVKNHVHNILAKLHVKNRTQAVSILHKFSIHT